VQVNGPRRVLRRPDIREDGGAVALLTALLMVVFIGMAALSVDVAREYAVAAQLQKAADAGSLAGAVYLPDNVALASSTAKAVVASNYKNNTNTATLTINVSVGARPTQLVVTVSTPVDFAFGSAIGVASATVTRTSKAEFAGPSPMGSPCNIFGRNDMTGADSAIASTDCTGVGTYWANVAGTNVNKARGDAYADSWCTVPDAGSIDNCSPAVTSASAPGTNTEYNSTGYTYIVRVQTAGMLTLEGYDIEWAATGDTCTGTDSNNLAGAAGRTNDFVTSAADSTARYAATGGAFCPGDTQMGYSNGDLSIVRTDVLVRQPPLVSSNPLDGATIAGCTRSWNGWGDLYTAPASNASPTPALTTNGALDYAAKLDKTKPTYDKALAEVFHRWAPLCTVGAISVQPGDYSIQVRTTGGGGQNRFGLRAQLSSGNQNVSIFAAGKESMFNNVTAGTSTFHLVRLGSGAAAHNLTLRFFDIGDASAPVSATVLQPDTSTLASGVPFSGCIGAGPVSGPLAGCAITTTSATNGGKWQTITIPIPASYACNDDHNQAACWVKIRLSTTAGQSDTTTWTAGLDGDPVRIVG
jgi:Flp pilus assembly protein TadG